MGARRWARPAARKYYWLLFSSNRADIPPVMRRYPDPAGTGEPLVQVTQLYMTVVVVEGTKIQSFPAVYLWNQPTDTLNTTPIWENLIIPRDSTDESGRRTASASPPGG